MRGLYRLTRLALAGLLFALAGISGAWAFPVTWTLSGATFSDGGTATGTLVYDADTNSLSSWSVSVAGGNTGLFPPITYDPSAGNGVYDTGNPTTIGFLLQINSSTRALRLPGVSTLSDAGGTVAINLASGFQGECFNCSPYRAFTAGNLVGTAAPNITSAASATFTLGTAGTFTVTSTGAPVAALSETGTLPSGVTFVDNGNGTATLSGTPAAGTGGTYALTITANNGVAPNATQNFTLTVNQAPAITSAASVSFLVGSAGSFTVTSTGTPTAALSETGTLPSGVTFVDNGNGTATLSGTPGAGTAGTYTLTITASNGVAPNATQTFALNVQALAVVVPTPTLSLTGLLWLGLLLALAGMSAGFCGMPRRK